MALQIDI